MSYDLMVFSSEAALTTRVEFRAWYDTQTAWTEDHSYDDPAVTTPALQAWLRDMVPTFPDLNGPDATEDHTSAYETDYSIGRAVIYAAFSWSLTKEANQTAFQLAQKHQVGFYDPSFEGPILLPVNGELRPLEEDITLGQTPQKPWWKR